MMLPTQINALRLKYGIDPALLRARHRTGFFVRRYRMFGQEILRARIDRALSLNLPGGGRMRKTTWLAEESAPHTPPEQNPVLVDSFEYGSFAEAEQALWSLLSEFHVPVDLRARVGGMGDVGFVTPDNRLAAFLRGNSLHRIAQEMPTGDLAEIAASVDDRLTAKPEAARVEDGLFDVRKVARRQTMAARIAVRPEDAPPVAAQFAIRGVAVAAPKARADTPDDGEPMLRIFTKEGWIEERDGLTFNLSAGEESAGTAEIEVYEDRADGTRTRCARKVLKGGWTKEG